MDNRVPVTIITGGYNRGIENNLILETYPRWDSTYIKFTSEDADVRLYIDYPFDASNPVLKSAACSIAVMEEPYFVVPEFNHFLYHHLDLFDAVFTNHPGFIALGNPKIKYYPGSISHIAPHDRGLWPKTDMICAMFSTKNHSVGHKLRQEVRNNPFFQNNSAVKFVNSVPFVENSYKDKIELFNPFRYSIDIENEFDSLFTEKLLDCFLTGCIPIYKGNKHIDQYFNMQGVLQFDTMDELKRIVTYLEHNGIQHYERTLNARWYNFETAKRFVNLGDVLWTHGLEDMLKQKGIV